MATENAGQASLTVRWLPSAKKSYAQSMDYIAGQDQRSADLVAARVEEALAMIAAQPGIGTPARHQKRRFPIPKTGHIIEYYMTGSEIRITRWVRHTRKS